MKLKRPASPGEKPVNAVGGPAISQERETKPWYVWWKGRPPKPGRPDHWNGALCMLGKVYGPAETVAAKAKERFPWAAGRMVIEEAPEAS